MDRYNDIAFSPGARRHQARRGSRDAYESARAEPAPDGLGPDEIAFLSERDSFYLASVGEDGWPYVQHRGGPPGFVKVTDDTHLVWADRPGNRQYVTAGNVDTDDRVSIIAVDYPNRRRLKLFGHATFDGQPDPHLLASLGLDGRLEGIVTVEVVAFAWNCPKYITPRYTTEQVRALTDPLVERIRELEAQLGTASTDAAPPTS